MAFLEFIIEELAAARDFFYDAYNEVKDWFPPLHYLATPLYGLYGVFYWLARKFEDFNEWVDYVASEISNILSWSTIRSFILDWLPSLEDIQDWFLDWARSVVSIITTWWETQVDIVKGLISAATEGLAELIVAWNDFWTIIFPQWITKLDLLASDWSNFVTQKLPTLFDITYAEEWWVGKFSDVTSLIDTAVAEVAKLSEGWLEWKGKVAEFFTNPVEWGKTHILEPIIEDFNRGFDKGLKGE